MLDNESVRYARSGAAQIAYRVVGAGPPLLCLNGTVSGVALADLSPMAPWMDRLRRFARVVLVDPRGTGASDPLEGVPTVEEQAADVRAVLDDARIDRAYVSAFHAGAGAAISLAVEAPERVLGLITINCWARMLADADCPWGMTDAFSDQLIEAHRAYFGTGMFSAAFSPSRAGDPDLQAMWVELERRGSSRAQSMLLTTMAQRYDVRHLLHRVHVPTVVMHSRENTAIPVDHARYLAARIPGAALVEFGGTDHAFMFENPEPVLVEMETLVTGVRPLPEPERVFAAIVFTDIVDSTRRVVMIGDRAWRGLIERHDTEMAALVTRHGGRLVKTIGDGVLAAFPLASHALRFAERATQLGAQLDVGVRVGVHAGEVDERGDDLTGVAVNLSARVVAIADAGQVIVSSTVRDLVGGATFEFRDLGTQSLKGFADSWRVFQLL